METIRFGTDLPELSYYEKQDWLLNETRIVEFFPNKYYEVSLISTAEDNSILLTYLSKIDTKSPIAIDLEWEDELCLFQFCYELTVVIIRHPKGEGNKILFNFLKDHFFYGKGINHDLQKLFEKFNYDFKDNIEDIARTRLEPYGHSINFIQMTLQFAGKPTAEFKDVRITKSNWDVPQLSMRQVLYAAFDVVAISVAYPNFPPPMEMVHHKKKSKSNRKVIRRSEMEFDPEKENNRRRNKMIKQKFETSERVLWHNRIVLKQSQAQRTHCYLVSNYKGPSDCITLKKTIFGSFCKKDIDHIGCVCHGEKKSIIISLFVDHPELLESKEMFIFDNVVGEQITIEKIETVDPEDCTDNDVLFIPPDAEGMQDEDTLSLILYSFGFDIRFTKYSEFIRIQPHRAQQSLIVKTFFPRIFGIKIYTFPDFSPIVRAFMPPHFDEHQIRDFFASNVKHPKDISIKLLRRKTEKSEQNVRISFSSVEEAEEAISKVNYKKVGDFTCYAQRFTDENHIRFLRFFELTVQNNIDYSQTENDQIIVDTLITNNYEIQVRKRYEKYGRIFQCKYDKNFNVYRVQFLSRNDAILAMKSEKNASFPPTGTMAFVRNLPFTITDEEVLKLISPYGKVLGFVYREIDEFMRNLVVEVTYTSVEEAHAIKKALHQKVIYGEQLEINVVNTLETEAPIWKMQQRKLYVKLNALNDPENNENQKEETNKIDDKNENQNNNVVDENNNNEDQNNNVVNENNSNFSENINMGNDNNIVVDNMNNIEVECNNSDGEKKGDDDDESNSNLNDDELNYSSDVDHEYFITNYEGNDDEDNQKVTKIGPFELLKYLSKFGHVIDIRGDYVMFLTFKEAVNAQSSIFGSAVITTNEFVQEIFPSDFSVINVEYLKKPFKQSQPMAVIIDPLPDGLTEETINHYLDGVEGYFIVFDQISSETSAKTKLAVTSSQSQDRIETNNDSGQRDSHSYDSSIQSESVSIDAYNNNNIEGNSNDYSEDEDSTEDDYSFNQPHQTQNDVKSATQKHNRAIVYAKSKRAMNIVHSKLHNQTFNGELLNLSKYAWNHVPQRPKNLHPFAELNPPRKQPIIVDPIPIGTKAIDVRKTCEGCGKFDVKVEGSAEKAGMCRAIVQPRNTKAKVNCLLALENAFGKAKRYPRDGVPPILQENLEEESDYE